MCEEKGSMKVTEGTWTSKVRLNKNSVILGKFLRLRLGLSL